MTPIVIIKDDTSESTGVVSGNRTIKQTARELKKRLIKRNSWSAKNISVTLGRGTAGAWIYVRLETHIPFNDFDGRRSIREAVDMRADEMEKEGWQFGHYYPDDGRGDVTRQMIVETRHP